MHHTCYKAIHEPHQQLIAVNPDNLNLEAVFIRIDHVDDRHVLRELLEWLSSQGSTAVEYPKS